MQLGLARRGEVVQLKGQNSWLWTSSWEEIHDSITANQSTHNWWNCAAEIHETLTKHLENTSRLQRLQEPNIFTRASSLFASWSLTYDQQICSKRSMLLCSKNHAVMLQAKYINMLPCNVVMLTNNYIQNLTTWCTMQSDHVMYHVVIVWGGIFKVTGYSLLINYSWAILIQYFAKSECWMELSFMVLCKIDKYYYQLKF